MSSEAESPSGSPTRGTGRSTGRSVGERFSPTRHAPDLIAAGAGLVSGVLLLHWFSRLTFWRDEWGILLHRRGWSVGAFLDPAVEHLVAIPILAYKLLLETAGMGSPAPFQVVAVLGFLLSVGLLYLYARSRVGPWLALAGVLPVLFLGPSWDDLLFAYQIGFFGSIACGIGALLCLDRRDRAGDLLATALLVAGLLFSDAGIPFVAGAVVEIGFDRDRLGRVFVFAVPTGLWLLWYLGWGHTAHTFVSFHNLLNAPSYILDGLGSSLSSLLGLSAPPSEIDSPSLAWGRPLLVLLGGLTAWRFHRLGRPPVRLLTTLVIMLGFWALTALDASVFGLPTAGRYQYIGIVLLLLFAAELMRGERFGRWILAAVLAVSLLATLANFERLRTAAHGLEGIAQREKGGLAALELARDRVDPALVLTQANSGVDYLNLVDARSYLSAVDAFGSPAYTPAELATAPEPARVSADQVSGAALGIRLAPAGDNPGATCASTRLVPPGVATTVPAGGLIIEASRGGVQAALRRFASESFPVAIGTLPAGRPELLRIPSDASDRPWTVQLSGAGPVRVCQPGGSEHG